MPSTRSRTAQVLVCLVFAVPTLASCGFDYATDRVYTPAAGANVREGQVDVLGAVIVSSDDGSGTLLASLANNSTAEPVTFDTVGAGGGGTLTVEEFEPIEIAPGGLVNLAEETPITVSGDFVKGDYVNVVFAFGNGERTAVDVPVYDNAGYYGGYDGPADPTPTPEESHSDDESH